MAATTVWAVRFNAGATAILSANLGITDLRDTCPRGVHHPTRAPTNAAWYEIAMFSVSSLCACALKNTMLAPHCQQHRDIARRSTITELEVHHHQADVLGVGMVVGIAG